MNPIFFDIPLNICIALAKVAFIVAYLSKPKSVGISPLETRGPFALSPQELDMGDLVTSLATYLSITVTAGDAVILSLGRQRWRIPAL